VTLFALIGMGILFGPLGLLLAAPLTVVGYVMVGELYVRRTLGGDIGALHDLGGPPSGG
jgi:predicted PurR-regulated permease PerM